MADDDLSFKSHDNKDDEDNSDSEATSHLELDLGVDSSFNVREFNRLGNHKAGVSGVPSSTNVCDSHRREDNPFSFKHFLRSDSTNSYQSKGARPKVYENRSASTDFGNHLQPRLIPEYPAALPDFVQDHLVVEQCYLGNTSSENFNVDIDNLPDFTPARQSRNNALNPEVTNTNRPVPLDLPMRTQESFPLDLPVVNTHSNNIRIESSNSEVSNIEQLAFKNVPNLVRQIEALKAEVGQMKMEIQNLKEERSNLSAEEVITEIQEKQKRSQLNGVKSENQILRGEGAAGGYNTSNQVQFNRLAQELRNAAGSAEHSLRQLLTGVDNLRIMAASLENMHRIEETRDPFSNFDEDAGPAL
uniref:Endosome-associated-trafficking regulator 1 n=1 Tax=Diabrotica virgifera virgifera TaxID=50390 RepID=A0A6P7GH38_DIAVI